MYVCVLVLFLLHTTANNPGSESPLWPCLLSLRLLLLIPVDIVVVVGAGDDVAADVVGDLIVVELPRLRVGRPVPPVLGVGVHLALGQEELDGVEVALGGRQVERRAAVVVAHAQVD